MEKIVPVGRAGVNNYSRTVPKMSEGLGLLAGLAIPGTTTVDGQEEE